MIVLQHYLSILAFLRTKQSEQLTVHTALSIDPVDMTLGTGAEKASNSFRLVCGVVEQPWIHR